MPRTRRRAGQIVPSLALFAALTAGCAGHRAAGAASTDAGGASPLDVARAFYRALHRGDADGAAKLAASPRARTATDSFVKLANAYRELEGAVSERFGPEAARTVGYAERIAAEDEAMSRAKEEIAGDEAKITSGGQTLATLRRVNGKWRVVLEDALSTEDGLAGLAREAEATRRAAERVAPAIRHGLFDVAEDALEAFRNEVTKLMQGEPELTPGPAQEPGGVQL